MNVFSVHSAHECVQWIARVGDSHNSAAVILGPFFDPVKSSLPMPTCPSLFNFQKWPNVAFDVIQVASQGETFLLASQRSSVFLDALRMAVWTRKATCFPLLIMMGMKRKPSYPREEDARLVVEAVNTKRINGHDWARFVFFTTTKKSLCVGSVWTHTHARRPARTHARINASSRARLRARPWKLPTAVLTLGS